MFFPSTHRSSTKTDQSSGVAHSSRKNVLHINEDDSLVCLELWKTGDIKMKRAFYK